MVASAMMRRVTPWINYLVGQSLCILNSPGQNLIVVTKGVSLMILLVHLEIS